MSQTDTIYNDFGTTRYIIRHSKGAYSGRTNLTVNQAKAAIKNVDLPTSRQRAAEKLRRLKNAELIDNTCNAQ